MAQQPKLQIVETAAHAKGVDALPVEKQDALMAAFEIGRIKDTDMTRTEKLGFIESRMHELAAPGAVEKLSQREPELFDRIAGILDVAPPPADEHWMERIVRVQNVESKITGLGF